VVAPTGSGLERQAHQLGVQLLPAATVAEALVAALGVDPRSRIERNRPVRSELIDLNQK